MIPLNKEEVFTYAVYVSYFLYIVIALGLSRTAPIYLSYLDSFIRIFVSLFLIVQFNPFSHVTQFNDFDRKVAFSAGVFTFATTSVNQLLLFFYYKVKSTIKKHIQ
jgi:hypothetical protein